LGLPLLNTDGTINSLQPKSGRREKVLELLHKTGLQPEHYNRYPTSLVAASGKRIVIARALALGPSFIVCDESVSALDVSVQAQVLNLLNELKTAFGFTAIFISHDLSVIRYMSDRIAVMNNGIIEETGLTEEVYNNPQSVYTQRLKQACRRFYGLTPWEFFLPSSLSSWRARTAVMVSCRVDV